MGGGGGKTWEGKEETGSGRGEDMGGVLGWEGEEMKEVKYLLNLPMHGLRVIGGSLMHTSHDIKVYIPWGHVSYFHLCML